MLDVLMDENGDLPVVCVLQNGQAIIAQKCECRLRTVLGDWPLDTTAGIDWLDFLGRKPANVDQFAAVLVTELLDVTGVLDVELTTASQSGGVATIEMKIQTEDDSPFDVVLSAGDVAEAGNLSITVGGVIGHSRSIVRG